jgi:hypothetical protein
MKVTAGGSDFEVVECACSVPGRRAVVFNGPGGTAWPDLFVWDPVSQTVHYDGDQLREFMLHATRHRSIGCTTLLAFTDAVSALGRGVNRIGSGGYSGMSGSGKAGGIIASAGAMLNLMLKVLAFIVLLPFRIVGGITRFLQARSLCAEENKLIEAMPSVFKALSSDAGE